MRMLKRSQTNRVLFGVCGGIAEAYSVDADVVRAVWILAGLCGGIGLVPYVAALLLVPEGDVSPEHRPVERRNRNLGLGLIAVAGALLFSAIGIPLLPWTGLFLFGAWRVLLPLLLLGGGALLVWPALRGRVGLSSGRRLSRSNSNRMLAGVCAGLAEKLGLDPNVVRIAAVVLAFLTAGTFILLYLVLVIAIPEETSMAPPPAEGRGPFASPPGFDPPSRGPVDQVPPEDFR